MIGNGTFSTARCQGEMYSAAGYRTYFFGALYILCCIPLYVVYSTCIGAMENGNENGPHLLPWQPRNG
jgi:hypothetical protein